MWAAWWAATRETAASSPSYATGRITRPDNVTFGNAVGGLVGLLDAETGTAISATSNARILASYATVSYGSGVFGVVGRLDGGVVHAVFDRDVNLTTASDKGYATSSDPTPQTTSNLQSPTGYTGIYIGWDVTETGGADTGNTVDFWHFGANDDYPALNGPTGDGLTWKDFGYQLREGPTLTRGSCYQRCRRRHV